MNDRRLSWRAALVLLVLIGAGLTAWILYRVETFPARSARQVRDGIAEVLNLKPKVVVHEQVIFEQSRSIMETAVVSRQTAVERETESEWLGSKKKIRLRGIYTIKAGFDLTQPFTVRVEGRRVLVDLPPAKILSAEARDIAVLALQNGIWNKVNAADMEGELRALTAAARLKAADGGLLDEAREMLSARLREKFGADFDLELRTPGAAE